MDWNTESTDRWDHWQDVRQTAAKERKQWRLSSWIPFFTNSASQPMLSAAKKQRRYEDEDNREGGLDSDSDDDEDWRSGLPPPVVTRVVPVGAGFQHSVADFMANGMAPVAAAAAMASGPGPGQQPVLPGFPQQMQQFQSQSFLPGLQPWHSQPPQSWRQPQHSASPPP
ncbi:hypothetical protein B0H13DRAFT_2300797 [Mycena leptocephala]|nr:hypothetical protein B0H13DRAFT_2300797 [Mycena leptocephala]